MLKKIFLLVCLSFSLTACDDDKAGVRYATTNQGIANGLLTGTNLHFYGTMTVTTLQKQTFTTPKVWFEFAGSDDDFTLYLHKTRFATDMPRVEMRMEEVLYTPAGDKSLAFSSPQITPQVLTANQVGGGSSYQPAADYQITGLDGSINDIDCRISFTCAGIYQVLYEGKMVIKD